MFLKTCFIALFSSIAVFSFAHGIDGCTAQMQIGFNQTQGLSNYFSFTSMLVKDSWISNNFWGLDEKNLNKTWLNQVNFKKFVSPKFAVTLSTAYLFNTEKISENKSHQQGFADSKILFEYFILNQTTEFQSTFLSLSSGLELPTGKKTPQNQIQTFAFSSNSLDMPFRLNFQHSKNQNGFKSQLFYQVNHQAKSGLTFGNSYTFSAAYFKGIQSKNILFVPQLGLNYTGYANSKQFYKNNVFEYQNAFRAFMLNVGGSIEKKTWVFTSDFNLALAFPKKISLSQRQVSWFTISIAKLL